MAHGVHHQAYAGVYFYPRAQLGYMTFYCTAALVHCGGRDDRSLLERVGHRRAVDFAFITAAGPVVPFGVDKDDLSLRKRQRA